MEELNHQDTIVEAIKKNVRENKQADFNTVREGLKQVGFADRDILFSMAEIDFQLSPWGRKLDKLSQLKKEIKARFAAKHLKENQVKKELVNTENQSDREM